MPTPPGFATCSYELKHASSSRSAFITFGVDPTSTNPVDIAGLLHTAFTGVGSLSSIIDSNVTLQNTRVSLGTDGAEDIVGSSATTAACTKADTTLPANCAVLVHKVTTRGGRRGRGRMYIPWCIGTANVSETGVITPASITPIQNAVNAWMALVVANPGPLVLLHRVSAPGVAAPTTPGIPNPITNLRVDPLIATQRRRLGR